MLRETKSRGHSGLVCPSRTDDRGGKLGARRVARKSGARARRVVPVNHIPNPDPTPNQLRKCAERGVEREIVVCEKDLDEGPCESKHAEAN